MKKVYLIRHGLPDFPEGKRMCLGVTDIPLGPEGLEQARRMALRLPPVTAVFASPLSRAVQTARAIGEPVRIPGLRERGAGDWEGLTFDEIRVRFPELYAARGTDRSIPLPNSEPDDQALERFRAAMARAAELAPGDFAVVAHSGVIRLFLEALGTKRDWVDYTEIIPLNYENGTFSTQEETICETC